MLVLTDIECLSDLGTRLSRCRQYSWLCAYRLLY